LVAIAVVVVSLGVLRWDPAWGGLERHRSGSGRRRAPRGRHASIIYSGSLARNA
jgi:hypothetical protein